MKKLYIIFFSLAMIFFSCADEDLEPLLTSENAIFGSYVRLISRTGTVFDLANFSAGQTSFDVEFYDSEGGTTVANYDIYVAFDDNTSHNGNNAKARQAIRNFSTSDFGTSASGNVGVSVTITSAEVLSILGLTEADLAADDDFVDAGNFHLSSLMGFLPSLIDAEHPAEDDDLNGGEDK